MLLWNGELLFCKIKFYNGLLNLKEKSSKNNFILNIKKKFTFKFFIIYLNLIFLKNFVFFKNQVAHLLAA